MHPIGLTTPLPTRPNLESASFGSEPVHRAGRLAARDHRDDGSMLGGLIVMLSAALPCWVMTIILLTSLLW